MSEDTSAPGLAELLSQDDIDALIREAESTPGRAPVFTWAGARFSETSPPKIEEFDFRNPAFLTETEMRRVRIRQERFSFYLAARLSMMLRMDTQMKLAKLSTEPYAVFTTSLVDPAFISTFKLAGLNGVGILAISPRLAMTIVDRLLGGPGHSVHTERYLSDLEIALMGDILQAILEEWVRQWADIQELSPTIIGHENSGRFLQTAASDAIVLSASVNTILGDCQEPIHLALPYYTMEPIVREMQAKTRKNIGQVVPREKPSWRNSYDNIQVPVAAEWDAFQLPVSDLLRLRRGDVLLLPEKITEQTLVRVSGQGRFKGRLGVLHDRVTVQIQEILNPKDASQHEY